MLCLTEDIITRGYNQLNKLEVQICSFCLIYNCEYNIWKNQWNLFCEVNKQNDIKLNLNRQTTYMQKPTMWSHHNNGQNAKLPTLHWSWLIACLSQTLTDKCRKHEAKMFSNRTVDPRWFRIEQINVVILFHSICLRNLYIWYSEMCITISPF